MSKIATTDLMLRRVEAFRAAKVNLLELTESNPQWSAAIEIDSELVSLDVRMELFTWWAYGQWRHVHPPGPGWMRRHARGVLRPTYWDSTDSSWIYAWCWRPAGWSSIFAGVVFVWCGL